MVNTLLIVAQWHYIVGLVQNCSISSVLAMEILQSCTKPSIWFQTSWSTLVWVMVYLLLGASSTYSKAVLVRAFNVLHSWKMVTRITFWSPSEWPTRDMWVALHDCPWAMAGVQLLASLTCNKGFLHHCIYHWVATIQAPAIHQVALVEDLFTVVSHTLQPCYNMAIFVKILHLETT